MEAKDMIPLMTGDSASDQSLWRSICLDMDRARTDWIASLRAQGVKAAHPDDGWVDRKENSVQFTYPQFNDGAKAGDIVALGCPDRWRLVRLTDIKRGLLGSVRHTFEVIEKSDQTKKEK